MINQSIASPLQKDLILQTIEVAIFKRYLLITFFFLMQYTFAEDQIDIRYYELEYSYNASQFGKQINAGIICRPINDTLIAQIPVLIYQFIYTDTNSSDTSYQYLQISDTAVINYAWQGNTPRILLKAASDDPVVFEESPYTIFVFPYQSNKEWLTRPVTTGLQSKKQYSGQESVTVPAGTFYCQKIHEDLLVAIQSGKYCDQWTRGNVLIKSYLNQGEDMITDTNGVHTGKVLNWETYELKAFRYIEKIAIRHPARKITVSTLANNKNQPPYPISLSGRKLPISNISLTSGVYVRFAGRQKVAH